MLRIILTPLVLSLLSGCPTHDDVPQNDTDTDTESHTSVTKSGLERVCDRYIECGGSYYATAQDCIDASISYWGACPSRRAALDAFGDCMAAVSCDDYTPDTYDPASTACAGEWTDLQNAEPCD